MTVSGRPQVTVEDTREAHPISPYGPHVPGWRLLAATVAQIFPEAVTVPSQYSLLVSFF